VTIFSYCPFQGLYRNKHVAIKVLKETAEAEVDEFKKEFEIMSAVRHPNVVGCPLDPPALSSPSLDCLGVLLWCVDSAKALHGHGVLRSRLSIQGHEGCTPIPLGFALPL